MIDNDLEDPIIFHVNFVYPDGTRVAAREMRLRELTFTILEASSFEIKAGESLKNAELACDAEALACEGLPTFQETLASLTLGENDLESLVFFDFAQVFTNITLQMTTALMDSDALFVNAYDGYVGARIVLQEHIQGVRLRSEPEVMALCRIAFRTIAYMRRAIRAATEETAAIRAQLNEGEQPAAERIPPSPAALALLTVPTREVIAALGGSMFSKKQSAYSTGRRAEVYQMARRHYFDILKEQNGLKVKKGELAKDILARIEKEGFPKNKDGIAQKISAGKIAEKFAEWSAEIK